MTGPATGYGPADGGGADFYRLTKKIVRAAGAGAYVHFDAGEPPGLALKLTLDGNDYMLTLIPATSTGSVLRRAIDAGIRMWRGK